MFFNKLFWSFSFSFSNSFCHTFWYFNSINSRVVVASSSCIYLLIILSFMHANKLKSCTFSRRLLSVALFSGIPIYYLSVQNQNVDARNLSIVPATEQTTTVYNNNYNNLSSNGKVELMMVNGFTNKGYDNDLNDSQKKLEDDYLAVLDEILDREASTFNTTSNNNSLAVRDALVVVGGGGGDGSTEIIPHHRRFSIDTVSNVSAFVVSREENVIAVVHRDNDFSDISPLSQTSSNNITLSPRKSLNNTRRKNDEETNNKEIKEESPESRKSSRTEENYVLKHEGNESQVKNFDDQEKLENTKEELCNSDIMEDNLKTDDIRNELKLVEEKSENSENELSTNYCGESIAEVIKDEEKEESSRSSSSSFHPPPPPVPPPPPSLVDRSDPFLHINIPRLKVLVKDLHLNNLHHVPDTPPIDYSRENSQYDEEASSNDDNLKFGSVEHKAFLDKLSRRLQKPDNNTNLMLGGYNTQKTNPKSFDADDDNVIRINENVITEPIDRNDAKEKLVTFLKQSPNNGLLMFAGDKNKKLLENNVVDVEATSSNPKTLDINDDDINKSTDDDDDTIYRQNMNDIFRSIRLRRKIDSVD